MKAATLAAGLTLSLMLPALAESPTTVNEVRHTSSGTEITIKSSRPPAPRATRAAGPSFREYDLAAPATTVRQVAPVQPVQQQRVVVVQQAPSYHQTFAPGPNTGMANNGFFTPGGASILSTGPIWGGYGFAGGLYGSGYGFAGGGGYGYGYYPYPGFAGNGFGYAPYYLNGNLINTPIQRINPTPGQHPYSTFNPAPQSFYPSGYGPGYTGGYTGYNGGYRGYNGGGGYRGGGGGYRGGGGRCR